MKYLKTGTYYGTMKKVLNFNGLVISDNEYKNISKFPNHYHENPYFAFILKGHYNEVLKNGRITCSKGNVIFHNKYEKHSNDNFSEYCRIINLELSETWLKTNVNTGGSIEATAFLNRSSFDSILSDLLFELIYADKYSSISIELLAANILSELLDVNYSYSNNIPHWVKIVREYIHENDSENISLSDLAENAGIHPVHLSRYFRKFFHLSFGDYIRKIKINKSIEYLKQKEFPITQIAYCCGFADHSHYTRTFKLFTGISPLKFRKMICCTR